MKTRMPIATISYNSDNYLILKLQQLQKAKIISTWFFINHIPEDDEKKPHKHVYIEPSKTIQTDDLLDEFIEPNLKEPSKPFKCLHFHSSKFADWYLYALHNKSYLASKGQSRRHHYDRDEIIASDTDELDELIRTIDMTKYSAEFRMMKAIKDGLSFTQFFERGNVPLAQFIQYQKAWDILSQSLTFRGSDGQTHEDND